MGYQDKSLACADCGNSFTFTASEQEFHAQKGFQNEPRRCPDCRVKRRQDGGNRGGAAKAMTKVVCAGCKTETEVPFVPRGDKPVYCRACFDQQRGGRGGRR